MDIKKAIVDGVVMEVVTQEEFTRRKRFNDPELLRNTCIEQNGTLFPVMNSQVRERIAPYAVSNVGFTKYYNQDNNEKYKSEDTVIDFSDVESNKANSDTYTPIYNDADSPALTLVKQCLQAKNVPLENYKGRFDTPCDFNNTIRLVTPEKNHTISIQKIKTIGEKFDIKFKLVAEDQEDSPNAMGVKFEKEI